MEVLDGVVVMDASVENIFVCSIIFVSVFKIPLRSEAVGVDIRSSVLLIVEAATIYDWLVCWIVLGGSFVFNGLVIFPFVSLFLFAAAAVASIKEYWKRMIRLVECYCGGGWRGVAPVFSYCDVTFRPSLTKASLFGF